MQNIACSNTVLHSALAKKSLSFFCTVLETALSSTCFEFCSRIFHHQHGPLLLSHDTVLTAQPRTVKPVVTGQTDNSRNKPQKSLIQYITVKHNKQTSDLRQGSEESACFLLSFFCDDYSKTCNGFL